MVLLGVNEDMLVQQHCAKPSSANLIFRVANPSQRGINYDGMTEHERGMLAWAYWKYLHRVEVKEKGLQLE